MKAGILTFHRALNYGALLQAFALKNAIKSIGVETDIIDYRNDFLEKMYEYQSFFSQTGVKNKLRYILYSRIEKEKRKKFEDFRQKYLETSEETFYNKDNIHSANQKYDMFFTGSDQVWSPDAHKLDGTFFLDFVTDSSKKYSYAASFGVAAIRNEYHELYRNWFKDFSVCSVREKQGENIIKQILDVPVRVDIDPVLLLTKEEWKNALGFKESNEKYAFIYSFGLTENQKRMAKACYEAGMKIYIVGQSVSNPLDVPCKFLGDLGPKEFAEMLYGASYVITNSFHGTALSIVYNVPFSMEYLVGGASKANSRLENIISTTSLQQQILDSSTDCNELLNQVINWSNVNKIIAEMKEHSYSYFRGIAHENHI